MKTKLSNFSKSVIIISLRKARKLITMIINMLSHQSFVVKRPRRDLHKQIISTKEITKVWLAFLQSLQNFISPWKSCNLNFSDPEKPSETWYFNPKFSPFKPTNPAAAAASKSYWRWSSNNIKYFVCITFVLMILIIFKYDFLFKPFVWEFWHYAYHFSLKKN